MIVGATEVKGGKKVMAKWLQVTIVCGAGTSVWAEGVGRKCEMEVVGADVVKPLAAVSAIVDAGNEAVFAEGGLHLGLHRADVQCSAKEACRRMSRPLLRYWAHLMRLARHLLEVLELEVEYCFMAASRGSSFHGQRLGAVSVDA